MARNGYDECCVYIRYLRVAVAVIGCFKKRVTFTNILFRYEYVVMLIFMDAELF
jgi:hypothetical protein